MKVKIYIVLLALLAIPIANGQTTDTISKNTKRPPVLDLLGRNSGGKPQSVGSLPTSQGRQTTPPKKSKKTVTNSAPREKSILTRALSEFVPNDQFNISVIKDEIYEITEYTSDDVSLPGVLVDAKSETRETIELVDERFAVRLEIDTTGVSGDIAFFERLMYLPYIGCLILRSTNTVILLSILLLTTVPLTFRAKFCSPPMTISPIS